MPSLRGTPAQAFQCRRCRVQGSGFYRTDSRAAPSTESDGAKPEKKAADAGKEVAAKADGNGSATDKAAVGAAKAASTGGSEEPL